MSGKEGGGGVRCAHTKSTVSNFQRRSMVRNHELLDFSFPIIRCCCPFVVFAVHFVSGEYVCQSRAVSAPQIRQSEQNAIPSFAVTPPHVTIQSPIFQSSKEVGGWGARTRIYIECQSIGMNEQRLCGSHRLSLSLNMYSMCVSVCLDMF